MRKFVLLFLALSVFGACGGKDHPEQAGGTGGGDSHTHTTVEIPAVPSGITLVQVSENSAEIEWSMVAGATRYTYSLNKEDGTQVDSKTVDRTYVSLQGLRSGTLYRFQLRAENNAGASDWSAVLAVKTAGEASDEPDPIEGNLYEAFRIPEAEESLGALAFPGAEGGGMYTTGGRGGEVYHVTNLNDSGSGSLRNGISFRNKDSKGDLVPRTIVFDVAGIITLASDLKITSGNLTIAGQTAPGDGICIKNYCTWIDADNVIIRFVRFRLGDQAPWTSTDIEKGKADGQDCINGRYHSNIILDHCSMSWSVDECASFYANENFTLQWCLMAESMKSCGLHKKTTGGDAKSHGYCGLWGGKNASFHHNILAHHDSRNARIDHPHIYENHTNPSRRGNVELRNNVIYDWGNDSSYGGEGGWFNFVNNYYKPGPSSQDRKYFVNAYAVYASCDKCGSNIENGYPSLYFSGNVHTKYSTLENGASGVYWHDKSGHDHYNTTLSAALPIVGKDGVAYSTTHTAALAMERACAWAGASLKRDAVDERVAAHVKDGSGQIIEDIAKVKSLYGSAWPEYKGDAVTDTDQDGIPDTYEALFSLNPNNPSDAAAKTLDTKGRYTNLEMYLHYLVKDVIASQNEGGTYQKL